MFDCVCLLLDMYFWYWMQPRWRLQYKQLPGKYTLPPSATDSLVICYHSAAQPVMHYGIPALSLSPSTSWLSSFNSLSDSLICQARLLYRLNNRSAPVILFLLLNFSITCPYFEACQTVQVNPSPPSSKRLCLSSNHLSIELGLDWQLFRHSLRTSKNTSTQNGYIYHHSHQLRWCWDQCR